MEHEYNWTTFVVPVLNVTIAIAAATVAFLAYRSYVLPVDVGIQEYETSCDNHPQINSTALADIKTTITTLSDAVKKATAITDAIAAAATAT
ncbi:hypothetical protein S7711_10985, partial [Stachybotrys chartarum IBT 7711]